jgi:hypothetical protein
MSTLITLSFPVVGCELIFDQYLGSVKPTTSSLSLGCQALLLGLGACVLHAHSERKENETTKRIRQAACPPAPPHPKTRNQASQITARERFRPSSHGSIQNPLHPLIAPRLQPSATPRFALHIYIYTLPAKLRTGYDVMCGTDDGAGDYW